MISVQRISRVLSCLLPACLCLAAPSASASAQVLDSVLRQEIGITTGFEYGPLALVRAATGGTYGCDCENLDRSDARTFRLAAQFSKRIHYASFLGVPLTLEGGLSLGITRTSGEARSRAAVVGYELVYPGYVGPPLVPTVDTVVAASLLGLELEAAVRFPIGRFVAGMAFQFRYRLSSSITVGERFLAPDVVVAAEGRAPHTMAGGDSLATEKLGISDGLTLSYDLPLGESFLLRPELRVRFDLEHIGSGIQWALPGAGVTLFYELPKSDRVPMPASPAPIPDRIVESDTASALPLPPLDPSVDLYAVGSDGLPAQRLAVRSESTAVHREDQPGWIITFDRASPSLPARYRHGAAAAQAFTPDSLARRNPAAIESRQLDLLGFRLRAMPGTSVTLVGSTARGESSATGEARAAAVASYLADVWGIDRTRLAVRAERSLAQRAGIDAPTVAIVPSSPAVTAPVITDWIEKRSVTPRIGLQPRFGTVSPRRWELAIRQGERVIAGYGSGRSDSRAAIDLYIDADHPETLLPVVAELTVTDSAGRTAVARDELPIELASASDGRTGADRTHVIHLIFPDRSGRVDPARLRRVLLGITSPDTANFALLFGSGLDAIGAAGPGTSTATIDRSAIVDALPPTLRARVSDASIDRFFQRVTSPVELDPVERSLLARTLVIVLDSGGNDPPPSSTR